MDALKFHIPGIRYTVDSYPFLTNSGFSGVKVVVGRRETALTCVDDENIDGEFELLAEEIDPAQP